MLDKIEVRELVCAVSTDREIEDVHDLVLAMHKKDPDSFGTHIISMNVEDVKATYYDTLRIAGNVRIHSVDSVLWTKVETEVIYGYGKDDWRQIPGKIMFGNGITWACMISLDFSRNRRDEYLLREMSVQRGIVELLRDLPVSARLGVRRDVRGVEEFYTLIYGSEVRLVSGFLDLTSLAINAGYKFHSKNMTAMEVQIIRILLNKTVSTGDYLWGIRWNEISPALQCYGLGDIRFGFITYQVLAGLLLRDLFPVPDSICRYLESDQLTAVNWFLDWVVLSLKGVEFHQVAEEAARSRGEMIQSLRYRDSRENLCPTPPAYVKIWVQLLSSWLSVTNGGTNGSLFKVENGFLCR